MIHWQSALHFSGFLLEFQSFLVEGVLGNVLIWDEDDNFDRFRSAFWEL